MRIISGLAKGVRLTSPPDKDKNIRPTTDRCREALFSILSDKINNSTILDLYAGTGALGLESLSRGAKSAIFIDNNKKSLSILKKNALMVQDLLASNNSFPLISVIKGELPRSLKYVLSDDNLKSHSFDIVFMDPPYEMGKAEQTLEILERENILNDDGIIVVEERKNVTLPSEYIAFKLYDKREYGDTCFWFYRKI